MFINSLSYKRKEIDKYKYYKQNLQATRHLHGLCVIQLDNKLTTLTAGYSKLYNKYKEHDKSKQRLTTALQSPTNPNYYHQYSLKLGHYRILANRYYDKSLEGNRALKYRLNFAIITSPIAPSSYY